MGMAGALAAFFGCPLGGSLFALEVNSRFGIEYFEHTLEAVFAGNVCVLVFRGLARIPLEPIWQITLPTLVVAQPIYIIYGAFIGLIGTMVAYIFSQMHNQVMAMFSWMDLLRNERAVHRALLGCFVIVTIGLLVPPTMFWGEFEFQTISTMSPSKDLPHVWPTRGLIGFEMDNGFKVLIVGVTKLIAISFSVAGGYRGGYIFPAMTAGAAFGRALYHVCPFIPVQICVLCFAASINVAITRTTLATTIIITYLAGEPNASSSILASSLVALFASGYKPFIKTQMVRADLDASLYHEVDAKAIDEEASYDH